MDVERSSRGKDFGKASRFKEEIADLYQDIVDAFADKSDQTVNLERYWRIFNTELTVNQAYNGNSQIYLPLVRDAIEARVTRFVNMLFPENEQHVECVSYGGDEPIALMAMLNHYVKRAELRLLAPALLRNGEVEGHYSVYCDWTTTKRYVTKKVTKPIEVDGIPDPEITYFDIEDDEIEDSHPDVEVLPASDLVVYPVTSDSVEKDSEWVAIRRRYSKARVKQLERQGVFVEGTVNEMMRAWTDSYSPGKQEDIEKKKIESAGIKLKGKFVEVFEVWKRFKIDGKRRWCRLFLWGQDKAPLAFTVNPNWNDRCSVISMPRTKVSGSFWGKSPVDAVEQLQYAANDAANMAWDSAQYSLLPIIMTDPEKNPNYATMVLSLAAIWQTNPNDTQFAQFPQLWRDALEITGNAKSQIMQSFGLNPAMMAQGVSKTKPSQAQAAQETAVAIETTANEVTTLEEGIFSVLLQRFFENDQQFRNSSMQIKVYGQLGIAAQMMEVPPFAWDDRYEFRWRGVSTFRSAQANQQMIAGLNILRSLPPVLTSGKRINLDPIIETLVENTYGPRLGARVLVDVRDQLSVSPGLENQIMAGGEAMMVHEMDNDQEHLQAHLEIANLGDPTGLFRMHIQAHIQALQKKQQQAGPPGGFPGAPGGGAAPGAAGSPRPGAQPTAPRGGQGPPGMIHADQMQDPSQPPRQPLQ
jgi:hypothetical protein